jgi:hypothetical protein
VTGAIPLPQCECECRDWLIGVSSVEDKVRVPLQRPSCELRLQSKMIERADREPIGAHTEGVDQRYDLFLVVSLRELIMNQIIPWCKYISGQ